MVLVFSYKVSEALALCSSCFGFNSITLPSLALALASASILFLNSVILLFKDPKSPFFNALPNPTKYCNISVSPEKSTPKLFLLAVARPELNRLPKTAI